MYAHTLSTGPVQSGVAADTADENASPKRAAITLASVAGNTLPRGRDRPAPRRIALRQPRQHRLGIGLAWLPRVSRLKKIWRNARRCGSE